MNHDGERRRESYAPPISDYAFLADCHSAVLISRDGSIDWCCMPRIDSRSCFGRLLDWNRGGYCRMAPTGDYRVERQYREDSLILETTFRTDSGTSRLIDFLPMRRGGRENPHQQIIRIIEGVDGEVPVTVDVAPRFDYGAVAPWIRAKSSGRFDAVGGADGLMISSDLPLDIEGRHRLIATFRMAPGQRRYLSIIYAQPEDLEDDVVAVPRADEIAARLRETDAWWTTWARQIGADGFDQAQCRRSAVVLKGMTYARTGAIAAAATTSLPEAPGGSRNWDYRFTWIRDSTFTVRSLLELGCTREADGFRRFVERCAAGDAHEVQILFGVDGRRRVPEAELSELSGYRGARPVRIGNAAAGQMQMDVFGELLDLAYNWHLRGNSPDEDYWEFIVGLIERTIDCWRDGDQGLWEMRGEPRHFVHSKAMCWVALDRGIRLAQELGRQSGDLDRWRRERDAVRAAIEAEGYDPVRGVFRQAFGSDQLDAALLLLPVFGFVPFDDERMLRTTDAICENLVENGLVRRYADGNDGLDGTEGVFITCTFWLAECLARQGRVKEACDFYSRALETRNDLGLFSEEFYPADGTMLGNFPQGLTHLSQIAAAVAISAAKKETR